VSSHSPEQIRALLNGAAPGSTVYLVGIGGCGVSGLAHLLLDGGFCVHGSDAVENEEIRQLRTRGAVIHLGHEAENLRAARPMLVVYSPAVRVENPELRLAQELNIPIARRAILLAALVNAQRGICVAGMHGKTTTSALLAYALTKLGAKPSYAVGALLPQMSAHARWEGGGLVATAPTNSEDLRTHLPLPSTGRGNEGEGWDDREVQNKAGALGGATPHPGPLPVEGRGGTQSRSGFASTPCDSAPFFVVEADESDGTLREFHPEHAIVLNVDAEHLDYFADVQAVCREFEQFAANTRGRVVFCADDARVAEMFAKRASAVSYGFSEGASYRAVNVRVTRQNAATNSTVTQFEVICAGRKLGEFSIRLLGEKNVSNATAAIALLHQLGFDIEAIGEAIRDFRGAARRQQELFSSADVRVFDDYGHHPNEIQAVLRAFKQLQPRRLVVAFQPHRYSRTLHLMPQFAEAFADADKLFLTEVYAASEPEIPGANSAALADSIRARGQQVSYVPALADVPNAIRGELQPGDLVLFLGAGDITKAAHRFADALRQSPALKARADGKPNSSGAVELPSSSNSTMNISETLQRLRATLSADTVVRAEEPLAKRTTLRVGGKADLFVEPANEADLAQTLRLCGELKLPFTIIGRGSNLLIKDGGIRGVVISLGHDTFSKVQIVGEHMHCGAGAKLKTVAVEARRAGLAGLEFLEGIPGSVGGALRMNAGAMGSWMFEVVEQIRFMDFSGNVHERQASEVNVEYRGCPLFKTHIALGAVLHGTPAAREVIQARASQFNSKRWETQPAQPSAGCIFKNPKTVPAGKLIDELGLKGTKCGGAMISTVHGNFIVNEGNATAKDVLELIALVKETAKAKRGIELETEVEILGE
jgi:UDP-N-acetylmuramate--alanine ligase